MAVMRVPLLVHWPAGMGTEQDLLAIKEIAGADTGKKPKPKGPPRMDALDEDEDDDLGL